MGNWKQLTQFSDQIKAARIGREDALYLLSRADARRAGNFAECLWINSARERDRCCSAQRRANTVHGTDRRRHLWSAICSATFQIQRPADGGEI